MRITNAYDSINRVRETLTYKNNAQIQTDQYVYDIAGNVRYAYQYSDQPTKRRYWNMTMSYDAFDRLTGEYGNANTWDYYPGDGGDHWYEGDIGSHSSTVDYDKSGNRVMDWGNYIHYSHNSLNQTIESGSPDYGDVIYEEYTYDTYGNLINDGTYTYNYDRFGRLRLTMTLDENDNLVGEEYKYDARDRQKYTKNGWVVDYNDYYEVYDSYPNWASTAFYSGSLLVAEWKSSDMEMYYPKNEDHTLFYRGPDLGGGVAGVNYACSGIGINLNYKHYNLRGDVVTTTNPEGNVLSNIYYAGYGNTLWQYGTQPVDKLRANTKREVYGDLINDGRRHRSPSLARFLQPDPLEYVDGLNVYLYCNNNPWGRFDPEGLFDWNDVKDHAAAAVSTINISGGVGARATFGIKAKGILEIKGDFNAVGIQYDKNLYSGTNKVTASSSVGFKITALDYGLTAGAGAFASIVDPNGKGNAFNMNATEGSYAEAGIVTPIVEAPGIVPSPKSNIKVEDINNDLEFSLGLLAYGKIGVEFKRYRQTLDEREKARERESSSKKNTESNKETKRNNEEKVENVKTKEAPPKTKKEDTK